VFVRLKFDAVTTVTSLYLFSANTLPAYIVFQPLSQRVVFLA